MRLFRPALWILYLIAFAAAASVRGESVRTLKAELSGEDLAGFAVENLVGRMRIIAGDGPTVLVTATIHAETEELAGAVRLERVRGDRGATLRVRYPYDRVRTFRYREETDGFDGRFLGFGFFSSSAYEYDGHTVRVNPGHGTRLHADVEVRVPRGEQRALFRNLVGRLDADGLAGELRFEVESADLRLDRLSGDLSVTGSSGDVRARDIRGKWKSELSSGDVRIEGFTGDSLSFRANSGDVVGRSIHAKTVRSETTSGDVSLLDADIQDFAAEATSGDITLEDGNAGLRRVDVHTSSGDVDLRLPRDAGFELEATQSSGDTRLAYDDESTFRRAGRRSTYRRGDGAIKIRVRTSSGDLSVRPS